MFFRSFENQIGCCSRAKRVKRSSYSSQLCSSHTHTSIYTHVPSSSNDLISQVRVSVTVIVPVLLKEPLLQVSFLSSSPLLFYLLLFASVFSPDLCVTHTSYTASFFSFLLPPSLSLPLPQFSLSPIFAPLNDDGISRSETFLSYS